MNKLLFISFVLFAFGAFAQTPIAEIQGQQDQSPMINQTVTIKGIVTGAKSQAQGYFVQDGDSAWTGIYVYDPSRSPKPAIGDEVKLTGNVVEYFNLTEIKDVSKFEIISTGNALPDPVLLKTGEIGEPYESVLVKIENATCTQVSLGFGEWEVNDGSGPAVINDFFYAFTPTLGVNYDITGPLDFSYEFYKIEPRNANDILINAALFFTVKPYQSNLSKSSITIQWQTNTEATSEVIYGKTEALELGSIKAEGSTTQHQLTIDGLDAGELYFTKAFSVLDGDTTPVEMKSYTTISNSSGEIKALFTLPAYKVAAEGKSAKTALSQIYTYNIADSIVSYINKSKQTLDIAIYDVINHSPDSDNTNQKIFDVIKAKAVSGVKVRVITDDESNDPFFTELLENAQVIWGNTDGIMHHKFLVVDAESETDCWVVTGSVNWTYNNLIMDANNLLMIQDRSLAKAYTAEFNEMWGGSQFEPDYSRSRFGSQKTDNTPHLFEIGGKKVELYFSPSDQTESKIVEALQTADYHIAFSMMAFTSDALGQALIDAHKRGVEIKGVIDYVDYSGSEFEILKNAGVDVVDFTNITGLSWPDDMTIHHKFAVIDYQNPESDPIVITGTHNWTASAESRNDENTLFIHDELLAFLYWSEVEENYMMSYQNSVKVVDAETLLYPNPTKNVLNVSTENEISTYLIFDVQGRMVNGKTKLNAKQFTIDVSGLKNGSYLIRMNTINGKLLVKRFVVI